MTNILWTLATTCCYEKSKIKKVLIGLPVVHKVGI